MGNLFTLEYGVAGVCVLLTISVLLRVGEFVLKARAQKESASEDAVKALTKAVVENTAALEGLNRRMAELERVLGDLPRLKNDIRRSFAAIKEVAGPDWPRIRDEIMKDEFTQ